MQKREHSFQLGQCCPRNADISVSFKGKQYCPLWKVNNFSWKHVDLWKVARCSRSTSAGRWKKVPDLQYNNVCRSTNHFFGGCKNVLFLKIINFSERIPQIYSQSESFIWLSIYPVSDIYEQDMSTLKYAKGFKTMNVGDPNQLNGRYAMSPYSPTKRQT